MLKMSGATQIFSLGSSVLNFFLSMQIMLQFLWVCRHAHPGSPYVYGLVGVDHDLEFPEPMPVIGIPTYCSCMDINTIQ